MSSMDQQTPGIEMRVEEKVLEVGKRVAMRAVEQNGLKFFLETLPRKRLLGRSLDKTDYVFPQQGGRYDISYASASAV